MKEKLFLIIVNLFWIVLSYFIFVSSIKESIILSIDTKKTFQYIFPEGWGFFTKEPKEGLVDIYQVDKNDIKELSIKNTNLDNYIGLSRAARIKSYELSMIISNISANNWKDDKLYNFKKHISDTAYDIKPKNNFQYFNKGEFLLVQRSPVPWAWASSNQSLYVPVKVLKIKIN